MRRPRIVRRVTSTGSHAFFVYATICEPIVENNKHTIMKHLKHYERMLTMVMLLSLISFTSCGDGDEGLIKNQPPISTTPETPSDPTIPEIQKHDGIVVVRTGIPLSRFFFELDSTLVEPTVDQVYVEPTKELYSSSRRPENVTAFRHLTLEPALKRSPRVHGRGNFILHPGLASAVPEDSLWFVANGWTINQHLQEQNQ